MRVSPRSAIWPQLVAISLMGLGAAGCADSSRFGDLFGPTSTSSVSRSDASALGAQSASANRIETAPLPHLASAEDGVSGRGGYQLEAANGAMRAASAPKSNWTWEGGTPITLRPGQTLEMVAREHGVPVAAIMQANNISNPAAIYPGERLVIPRNRSQVAAAAPQMHAAASRASAPRGKVAAPAVVHVVKGGQTLDSIARIYHKPVTQIARANNLSVGAKLKAGDRITIPELKEASQATPARVEASASPARGTVVMADASQSAHVVGSAPVTSSQDTVKNAEPAGSLPGFRWPVRGRVIAAFGPKPNGVQNDGINLAVPEGTPIKAAEDGVVAYAGSELKGYGNLVLVRHSNGFVTAYAHASDILVKRGETVKRGQVIAHAGQTGTVTSPQLHFEIRKGATPVDPAQYLNGA
jgi:murein DD-endopeptidase MepM/ murein hydrolase activator NlpD